MSQSFDFTLILGGSKDISDEMANRLYEAGLDDALVGSKDGEIFIDITRDANTLEEAVQSAISQVHQSGTGLRVRDVKPEKAKLVSGI